MNQSRFIPDVAGVGVLVEPPPQNKPHGRGDRPRLRTERRAALRVPCTLCVSDEISGTQQIISGHTVNFSLGGIAVVIGHALSNGQSVEVELQTHDGETRRISGAVIHCRQMLTGCFEIGVSVSST